MCQALPNIVSSSITQLPSWKRSTSGWLYMIYLLKEEEFWCSIASRVCLFKPLLLFVSKIMNRFIFNIIKRFFRPPRGYRQVTSGTSCSNPWTVNSPEKSKVQKTTLSQNFIQTIRHFVCCFHFFIYCSLTDGLTCITYNSLVQPWLASQ